MTLGLQREREWRDRVKRGRIWRRDKPPLNAIALKRGVSSGTKTGQIWVSKRVQKQTEHMKSVWLKTKLTKLITEQAGLLRTGSYVRCPPQDGQKSQCSWWDTVLSFVGCKQTKGSEKVPQGHTLLLSKGAHRGCHQSAISNPAGLDKVTRLA